MDQINNKTKSEQSLGSSTDSKYEYPVGVLVVHGIGMQKRGETLSAYVDALYGWVQDRIRGIKDGHLYRNTDWSVIAKAFSDGIVGEPTSRFDAARMYRYRSFEDAYARLMKNMDKVKVNSLPLPPDEPLFGEVKLEKPDFVNKDAPESDLLNITWTDIEGRDASARWLIAESYWAEEFIPPKLSQLIRWISKNLLLVLGHDLWARMMVPSQFKEIKSNKDRIIFECKFKFTCFLYAFAGLFVPLIPLLLLVVNLSSFIPIQSIKSGLEKVKLIFESIVGDAITIVELPSSRAAILSKVQKDLRWLSERCESVLVIGHSQGAMLAYQVCTNRPENVRTLVTLGSGVGKLEFLAHVSESTNWFFNFITYYHYAVGMGLLGCFGTSMLAFKNYITGGAAIAFLVLFGIIAVGGILSVAVFFTEAEKSLRCGILPNNTMRSIMKEERFKWVDFHATHDIVTSRTLDNPFVSSQPTSIPQREEVTNEGSVIKDHTSYINNKEDVVSSLVYECASLGKTESLKKWLTPELPEHRKDISQARHRIIFRAKGINRVITCFVVFIIAIRLGVLSNLAGYIGCSESFLKENIQFGTWFKVPVVDVGFIVVIISAFLSVRTGRLFSLKRLLTAILERRNYCVDTSDSLEETYPQGTPKEDTSCLKLVDKGFTQFMRLSFCEGLCLGITCVLPVIGFVGLSKLVGPWERVLWTFMIAIIVHIIALFLRNRELYGDIRKCWPHKKEDTLFNKILSLQNELKGKKAKVNDET